MSDINKKVAEIYSTFRFQAIPVLWQLSSGALHCEDEIEAVDLYDAFSLIEIDPDDEEDFIYLKVDGGYHRSILIKKSQIDYIAVPTHKLNQGFLDAAEDEIGD